MSPTNFAGSDDFTIPPHAPEFAWFSSPAEEVCCMKPELCRKAAINSSSHQSTSLTAANDAYLGKSK